MDVHPLDMKFREIRDLLAAWIVLGVAFANLYQALTPAFLLISMLTAGIGFLLHELAHKVVAMRFGFPAEFRADYQMLGVAFLTSFLGLLFAAPGAVMVRGLRDRRKDALVSLAGPATNIVLALGFTAVPGVMGSYGTSINSWLALFNMIPAGGLDGESVYRYSRPLYGATVLVSGYLVFFL